MSQMEITLQWIGKHRIQLGAGLFWLSLLLIARIYMNTNDVTFTELANTLSEQFTGEWYGPILYLLVYIARPLILFPASLLAILAGTIWGLSLGFVYGLIAGTMSVLLPYLFGRWFVLGRREQEPLESKALLERFASLLRRNPFQAVLTMRLLYLPYDAVSVLAGSLNVSFVTFFTATAIGNIGGTLSFVAIGASIEGDITSGDVVINPLALIFSFVALLMSFLLSRYMSRREQHSAVLATSDIIETS